MTKHYKCREIYTSIHHNMAFTQLLKFAPRHDFESLANQHHSGCKLRKMTRWTQFVCIATAQLSGHSSLRGVASSMTAQTRKLYHLGISSVSKLSLSRGNESQPYQLYEALFTRCQSNAPRHNFKFENKFYSLDGGCQPLMPILPG